jgi:hypothetical protein
MNYAYIFACQSLPTNFPYEFVCMSIRFCFLNIIGFYNLDLKANM